MAQVQMPFSVSHGDWSMPQTGNFGGWCVLY